MSKVNPNLIADLGRLATRYAPEDWTELSRLLRDEDSRAQLAALLDEVASASARQRLRSGRPPAPKRTSTRALLASLRKRDPQRADILSELWLKIRNQELLAGMPAIRAFSEAIGMKTLKARKHEQAASEVIQHLTELSEGALDAALSQATLRVDRSLGEEYERWVSLIIGREEPS